MLLHVATPILPSKGWGWSGSVTTLHYSLLHITTHFHTLLPITTHYFSLLHHVTTLYCTILHHVTKRYYTIFHINTPLYLVRGEDDRDLLLPTVAAAAWYLSGECVLECRGLRLLVLLSDEELELLGEARILSANLMCSWMTPIASAGLQTNKMQVQQNAASFLSNI